MSSCLGFYIEDNLIKYAKVSKEHDNFKVEAFGIKFYDNINEAIKQIVNETYSFKNPISTNLSEEQYIYTDLFSLLNQKDLNKAVKTEFEYFCNENRKNFNALEYRNLLIPNLDDKDKITSLYAYTEKTDIERKLQVLSGLKVNNISPLPISISNLLKNSNKKNKVIVNIENKTSITFIIDDKIQKVEIIDEGMQGVFNNIIMKENSYAKAYEICKNTTIYTMQGRNLQVEENEYMEDIMPILYNIVEKIKVIINSMQVNFEEIYITGLVAAINNIDLYFQENFIDKKCEILAPFFVDKSNIKLNIKDYIEVNSAIALALQGLGVGYKEMNFKNKASLDQLLTMEIGTSKKNNNIKKPKINLKNTLKSDFNKKLDNIEKSMIRVLVAIVILLIVYAINSNQLMNKINDKKSSVESFIADSKQQIAQIEEKTMLVTERKRQYVTKIEKIRQVNNEITESYARKNVIPNFLTQIMFNIPKEVQLLSITNTSGREIQIQAQAKEYEQLGYFIAKIRNEGILTNVTSTAGIKQQEFIQITINGNLAY